MECSPVHSLTQAGVDCMFLPGGQTRPDLGRGEQPIRETGEQIRNMSGHYCTVHVKRKWVGWSELGYAGLNTLFKIRLYSRERKGEREMERDREMIFIKSLSHFKYIVE